MTVPGLLGLSVVIKVCCWDTSSWYLASMSPIFSLISSAILKKQRVYINVFDWPRPRAQAWLHALCSSVAGCPSRARQSPVVESYEWMCDGFVLESGIYLYFKDGKNHSSIISKNWRAMEAWWRSVAKVLNLLRFWNFLRHPFNEAGQQACSGLTMYISVL